MGLTALQQRGNGLGAAAVGEYCGATTAARFGDPKPELAALLGGCGVYDLGFRAKIRLTGSDRVRWLNGMVTNNIRDLAVGQGVYSFLLNPQGHILGDLYAYNRGESGVSSSIIVDTDRRQIEKIMATFDHYVIMDDVEMKSLASPDEGVRGSTAMGGVGSTADGGTSASSAEEITSLGIAGPRSREVLRAAGIEIPEMTPLQVFDVRCTCNCECTQCTAVRGEDFAHESYELWLAPGDVRKTWDALAAQGATRIGYEALELQRVLAGVPLYGVDIRERDLPQETEQARALNFSKGCYVGQEIVERIRSRGAVHRKFSSFVAEGDVEIATGDKIKAGEKEVGEVTSVARFHNVNKTVVLGYIRRELGMPGREVMIGAAKATVVQAPVTVEQLSQERQPAAQQA
jgi:folate-binding protein YgfZ